AAADGDAAGADGDALDPALVHAAARIAMRPRELIVVLRIGMCSFRRRGRARVDRRTSRLFLSAGTRCAHGAPRETAPSRQAEAAPGGGSAPLREVDRDGG